MYANRGDTFHVNTQTDVDEEKKQKQTTDYFIINHSQHKKYQFLRRLKLADSLGFLQTNLTVDDQTEKCVLFCFLWELQRSCNISSLLDRYVNDPPFCEESLTDVSFEKLIIPNNQMDRYCFVLLV